jgi:signal peptidase II
LARSHSATINSRAILVLALVACGGFALDQISKALVVTTMSEGEIARVLNDVLHLHFIRNPGAAFSFATGLTWVFTLVSAGVVVFILWFARRIRSLSWAVVFGLLLGGVLGNLTDRLFREPSVGLGHVVDFISTPWMLPAVYNIADVCIVVSMALFLLLTVRGIGLDGRRTPAKASPAPPADKLAPAGTLESADSLTTPN